MHRSHITFMANMFFEGCSMLHWRFILKKSSLSMSKKYLLFLVHIFLLQNNNMLSCHPVFMTNINITPLNCSKILAKKLLTYSPGDFLIILGHNQSLYEVWGLSIHVIRYGWKQTFYFFSPVTLNRANNLEQRSCYTIKLHLCVSMSTSCSIDGGGHWGYQIHLSTCPSWIWI